jgi:type II secretory pathway pseudopilin PulG
MSDQGNVASHPKQTHGLAVASIIAGFVGISFSITCLAPLAILPGLVAVVTGHLFRIRARRGIVPSRGGGFATTGLVLGYLAMVAGIAALRYYPNQAKVARASADARNVAMAIEDYMKAEGRAPVDLAEAARDAELDPVAVLSGLLGEGRGTPSAKIYIEPPRDRISGGAVVDPWGRAYRVAVDGDGDGKISLPGIEAAHVAIAWSTGPDGIDDRGKGDDIPSWKP